MINNIETFYENDTVNFFVDRLFDATEAKIYLTGTDSNTEIETVLDSSANLFRFEIETNKVKSGDYSVYAIYQTGLKTKTEYVVDVRVLQDVTSSTFVRETHNQKILKAIIDKIDGRFNDDYDTLSINGRTISRTPMDQLFKYKTEYEDKVLVEMGGMGKGNKIKLIFRGRV